jgi:hypothetical protein
MWQAEDTYVSHAAFDRSWFRLYSDMPTSLFPTDLLFNSRKDFRSGDMSVPDNNPETNIKN